MVPHSMTASICSTPRSAFALALPFKCVSGTDPRPSQPLPEEDVECAVGSQLGMFHGQTSAGEPSVDSCSPGMGLSRVVGDMGRNGRSDLVVSGSTLCAQVVSMANGSSNGLVPNILIASLGAGKWIGGGTYMLS